MKRVLLYAKGDERFSLAQTFLSHAELTVDEVWLLSEDGDVNVESHAASKASACEICERQTFEIVLAHRSLWIQDDAPLSCIPPRAKRGPTVFYTSDAIPPESDPSQDIFWVNHGITAALGDDRGPLLPQEAKTLIEWARSGDLSALPPILQPRPKRQELQRLLAACQAYLVAWEASQGPERLSDEERRALIQTGWWDFATFLRAEGDRPKALAQAASQWTRTPPPTDSAWWTEVLLDPQQNTALRRFSTAVLRDMPEAKKQVAALLDAIVRHRAIPSGLVAAAYLEILAALPAR